jgi:type IV secretory pathway TraG/TraD family ATPase VirD4
MSMPDHDETLYRLPSYDHNVAQAVLAATFVSLLLDLALAASISASTLAARWRGLPGLGPPWLRLASYPDSRLAFAAILIAGAIVLLAVARRTRPAAGLLAPLLAALALAAFTPIYPPLAFLRWSSRFEHVVALAPGLRWGREVFALGFCALFAATLSHTVLRLRTLRETGDTHGSSHWASPAEVRATGLLSAPTRSRRGLRRPRAADPAPSTDPPAAAPVAAGGEPAATAAAPAGADSAAAPPAGAKSAPVAAIGATPAPVVVGAWRDRRGRLRTLRDTRDRHVLAFAPSGTGKTTCLVIPTLLEWPASAVVLDVKGELWHTTAAYRRSGLGNLCLRFDPACADGTAARYNPLLVIPRTLEDVKYAQSVADVLVDPDGRDAPRSFWEQSAHALLVGTILHVLYAAPEKSLAGCAHLLSDPGCPVRTTLDIMLRTHHDPEQTMGWRDPYTGRPTPTHPAIAAAARAVLDMDPRTSSGVIATAQSHLDLFRDPILAANTAASDFTAEDLVRADRPVTLYLTLAPGDLNRLRGLVRLILNQLCRRLTERLDFAPAAPRRRPLLLLLDEFTALGKLDFFGRALAYLRGYGIRVYISIQALVQLHEVYGDHQSITANCPLQIAFAPADIQTADLLSKMTGQRTVNLTTRSLSGASLVLAPRRATIARHAHPRPLLTPDEVRRLPDNEALIFAAGHAPIRGRRHPYYLDPTLLARIAPPPPKSDRLKQTAAWADARAVLPPNPDEH